MSNLFETYKKWRMLTETEPSERDLGPDYEDNLDYGDKKAFMKYAKLKKLVLFLLFHKP